ncbi:DUF308 domain-containing protein [Flavobacterium tegetincola]|uniref:DUF308 domain-containing protein n=1 Tax=Flavobacterium tegetincola TaxID=150172 RepID=UPI003CCC220D
MKKNLFVNLYGAIIILQGIFLLFEKYFTFKTSRYTLGITLIIGAILALVTVFSRKRQQVQFV